MVSDLTMIKLINESDGRKPMRKRGIRESLTNVRLKNVGTGVFPVVDFGCYWGILKDALDDVFVYDFINLDAIDPDDEYYDEIVELVEEKYDGRDEFYDQILRLAPKYIQEALDECGAKMKVIPDSCFWDRPREYNFRDDEIRFDAVVDPAWVAKEFKEVSKKSDFREFLKVRFSSRDGFISFIPDDVDSYSELLDPNNRDYWKAVAAIVGYSLFKDTSICNDATERLYEEVICNPDYVTCSNYDIF